MDQPTYPKNFRLAKGKARLRPVSLNRLTASRFYRAILVVSLGLACTVSATLR